jgi:glycosyltransferase involved in cell wall biosynthesis
MNLAKSGSMVPVSVVITTYNDLKFLNEAIASVQSQTLGPDEIIVVDDGSTCDPTDVVSKWSNASLVRQSNRGLASARNTGWRMAKNKYLVFLDADDRLRPNAIEINLAQFARHPECGFVYGSYCLIDEKGQLTATVPLRPVSADPYPAFLMGNIVGMHATAMYRRKCLEEVGGFNEKLRACEDYDLFLRASRLFPVVCTVKTLADYRRHDANMSNDLPMMLETALEVLNGQRRIARANASWLTAYRQGVSDWKSYYVRLQLSQSWEAVRTRRFSLRHARDLGRIALLAPLTVLRIIGRDAVRLGRD